MPTLSGFPADAIVALGRAWRWWTGELAQLVPGRTSWRLSRRPRADIRPGRTGVEIVRVAGGTGERLVDSIPLSAFDEENWRDTAALLAGHRVRLLLAPPLAHILTLKLPRTARPYLRTAIPLQLAEHAPLPLEQLDWRVVDTQIQGERLSIRVAMARTDVLDSIKAGFREHDIPTPPILVDMGNGKALPLRGQVGALDLSRPWAWASAILVATPVLLLLLLHLLVLRERDKVAELEEIARPRLAAERHIREQALAARSLNEVIALPAVTSLVEDLADHLPPTAHVLELSGHDDGSIDVTLSTTDVDATRTAMLGDERFVGMRQVGVVQTANGSSTVHFTGAVR